MSVLFTIPARTIEVFTVEELQELHPDGFRRAHENYQKVVALYVDEYVYDDLAIELAELCPPLEGAQMWYSLSHCQGGGLVLADRSLSADVLDALGVKVPEGVDPDAFRIVNAKVPCFSVEYTEYVDDLEDPDLSDAVDTAVQEIEDALTDLCRKLENLGYEQQAYHYSEQGFIDWSEANDDLYTEDGDQFTDHLVAAA